MHSLRVLKQFSEFRFIRKCLSPDFNLEDQSRGILEFSKQIIVRIGIETALKSRN